MEPPADNTKFVQTLKHFGILEKEVLDHHYLSYKQQGESIRSHLSFQRAIVKEWQILAESLPEAIFVQTYETRNDLFRAVIIGAPGTPYHDCLFFFDMCLPQTYPSDPPLVHYRSYGPSVNHNLHDNGYVCLSLLNKSPNGSEDQGYWSQNSTLLQVLVSIQGLVLTESLYDNKAADEKTDGDIIDKSKQDNNTSFTHSYLSFKEIVNKPPEGFEDFVAAYFRGQVDAALEQTGQKYAELKFV